MTKLLIDLLTDLKQCKIWSTKATKNFLAMPKYFQFTLLRVLRGPSCTLCSKNLEHEGHKVCTKDTKNFLAMQNILNSPYFVFFVVLRVLCVPRIWSTKATKRAQRTQRIS